MKVYAFLTATICLLICLICANAQDLSQPATRTDKSVASEKDELKPLEKINLCVIKNEELPRITIVGSFAFDIGCLFEGVFVESRYFKKEDMALSKHALAALGWEAANRTEREKLAQLWVKKGFHAHSLIQVEKNKDFKNRSFSPPQAVSKENGEIVVTLWLRFASAVPQKPKIGYQFLEYRFSETGDLLEKSTLKFFTR